MKAKKVDIKQAILQSASRAGCDALDYSTMKKPDLDSCLAELTRLDESSGIQAMKQEYQRRIDEINRLLAAMPREGK